MLVDSLQCKAALERIDQRLNQLRLRSSWLLRRARALKGLGRDFEPDTRTALAELERRLTPERPEPTWLLDRATAFALRGKGELARRDLASARRRGIPPIACGRVEAILKSTLTASEVPGSHTK